MIDRFTHLLSLHSLFLPLLFLQLSPCPLLASSASTAAHPDASSLLRRADRYAREADENQTQQALQEAYDAQKNYDAHNVPCSAKPADLTLSELRSRLDRLQKPETVITDLTPDDDTYLSIEKAWCEGNFWQAKKRLSILLDRLSSDTAASALALRAHCFYLQAEMECLQGDLPAAYQSYMKARSFAQSAYAPWYGQSLVKSVYCLLLSQPRFASCASQQSEVKRLIQQPSLSQDQRACLEEALQTLNTSPCSAQSIHAWVKHCVSVRGSFFALPEVYEAAQRRHQQQGLSEESALKYLDAHPHGLYLADHLHHLLVGSLKEGDIQTALTWKELLDERCPNAPKCAESSFCLARDAEARGNMQTASNYYREVAERFSTSPFAAESAFLSYPYQNYVAGNPKAIEHLITLEQNFPYSYYALLSRYVRTLHYLYPPRGVSRDPIAAIESFKEFLERIKTLQSSGNLQEREDDQVKALITNVLYEQARASLLVAQEAVGAKKTLFLAYSQTAYKQLLDRPSIPLLWQATCYEALAECAVHAGDEEECCRLLNLLLNRLDEKEPSHQRLCARAYYTLGASCARLQQSQTALDWLNKAQACIALGAIPGEERINIYVLKSQIHRLRGELDDSLKSLSAIVNDPSVSPRRLKALYERAEIFCEQGRVDCAKRQWEALLTTEGPFLEKAKNKLEEYRVH